MQYTDGGSLTKTVKRRTKTTLVAISQTDLNQDNFSMLVLASRQRITDFMSIAALMECMIIYPMIVVNNSNGQKPELRISRGEL